MNMQRRPLMVGGIVLLAATSAPFAQTPAKVWRIGYLSQGAGENNHTRAFVEGMRALGYIEGRNLSIEYRFSGEQWDRLPVLANELVQLKVDAIVTEGSRPVAAVKGATSTIPVVMAAASDPIGSGFIASLARPGGNLTGMSMTSSDLAAKDLELVREFAPKATRVALLTDPTSAGRRFTEQLQAAVSRTGMTLAVQAVEKAEQLPGALAALLRERPQLMVVKHGTFSLTHRKEIIEFAALNRLPAVYGNQAFANSGGLLSYGPDLIDMYRRAAYFVDRIVKGAKPADMPVEQPTKYELFINQKTASALGLTIPQSLLLRATEVIQ